MKLRKRRAPARRRRSILHHYFISGAHNSYRPLYLQLEAVLVQLAVIVLLFFIALGLERLVIRSPSPQVGAVVASVLVELANEDRTQQGLETLAMSPILQKAAQMKADDMAAKEYFAHDSPEGLEPWHWFEEAGYEFRSAGENLAVYFSDSVEVEKAWMNSPLHRANILNDRYTEVGIALAHGRYEGNETTFVVQMFGTPSEVSAAAIVASSPAPETETPGTGAGVSAEAQPVGAIKEARPSALWKILTAPKTTLQYVYTGLAALVLLALGFLFLTELRRLHVPSLFRGVALLALIGILIWGGMPFLSGELFIL